MIELFSEADGITKEMIEAQRAKIALIEQLLEAQAMEEKIKSLVAENETLFDHEFFQLLTAGHLGGPGPTTEREPANPAVFAPYIVAADPAGREIMEAEQKAREEVAATKEES